MRWGMVSLPLADIVLHRITVRIDLRLPPSPNNTPPTVLAVKMVLTGWSDAAKAKERCPSIRSCAGKYRLIDESWRRTMLLWTYRRKTPAIDGIQELA
jgi:hypothetical protein